VPTRTAPFASGRKSGVCPAAEWRVTSHCVPGAGVARCQGNRLPSHRRLRGKPGRPIALTLIVTIDYIVTTLCHCHAQRWRTCHSNLTTALGYATQLRTKHKVIFKTAKRRSCQVCDRCLHFAALCGRFLAGSAPPFPRLGRRSSRGPFSSPAAILQRDDRSDAARLAGPIWHTAVGGRSSARLPGERAAPSVADLVPRIALSFLARPCSVGW